jgi:FkbM family methyltransferase
MDIKFIIKDYFRSKNLQDFINRRFKDDSFIIVKKEGLKYVSYGDGLHFGPGSFSTHGIVEEMMLDDPYHVEDIYPNDVVIDVGANVGGFTLLAATRTRNRIIAVEPVLYDVLVENIMLNKREKQIIPLKKALGSGEKVYVSWGEGSYADTITLSELLKLAGGRCDFLKMDCEGGEWDGILQCDELDKIGRAVIEYHFFKNDKRDINSLVKKLEDYGFNTTVVPDLKWKPMVDKDPERLSLMHCIRDDWKHS